jgi:hypothetical protein
VTSPAPPEEQARVIRLGPSSAAEPQIAPTQNGSLTASSSPQAEGRPAELAEVVEPAERASEDPLPFRPEPEDEDEDEPYSPEFYDPEAEPFDLPGTEKMGIVGGKGVGKSYLFQAMVYRTFAGSQSGALNYYLRDIRLFHALRRGDKARTVNVSAFIRRYSSWQRLATTLKANQAWFRLRLQYRSGLFGQKRSSMDVEFFDGSGEGFFQAPRDTENRKLWREGYLDARVMVFCLPLWAVFPKAGLSRDDWKFRDVLLEGFEQVVQNYLDLRLLNKRKSPVRSILALTMADDRRR